MCQGKFAGRAGGIVIRGCPNCLLPTLHSRSCQSGQSGQNRESVYFGQVGLFGHLVGEEKAGNEGDILGRKDFNHARGYGERLDGFWLSVAGGKSECLDVR